MLAALDKTGDNAGKVYNQSLPKISVGLRKKIQVASTGGNIIINTIMDNLLSLMVS